MLIPTGLPGLTPNTHSKVTLNIALLGRGLSYSAVSWKRQKGGKGPEQAWEDRSWRAALLGR